MTIDGKAVSKIIKEKVKVEIEQLNKKGVKPGLAVVIVGENPASQSYVRSKTRTCEKLGIHSEQYTLSVEATEQELLELIDDLNDSQTIHGILVQLPLPKHMDENKVIEAIDPIKDVDGFHPINIGKVSTGTGGLKPCTPYGVIRLLQHYNLDIEGKHAVILGRSNIVGKPMAQLLLAEHATTTICHSRTADLTSMLKQADILVAAVGIPHFVKADMVKQGAVVIDVGINRIESGLVGDVDYDTVKDIASYITPVPGGVGPMTIAMLMENTLTACKLQLGL